jgi:hypothetical protein
VLKLSRFDPHRIELEGTAPIRGVNRILRPDGQEDATRWWKARARMIDPAQFFNPQNLERLLGGLSMPAI